MVYSFADFKIEYENIYDGITKFCADYRVDDKAEFKIDLTQEDIKYEQNISEGTYSKGYLEIIAFYRKMAECLPNKNAFVLHSALFDVDGVGVAFAAHSGTGKTTHMTLWKELLGERLKIVNGDKPIIRFFDDESSYPYGYGTPWCGKENLGTNTKTQLQHICFIERATENSCEQIDASKVVDLIFNQVYMPKNPSSVINTMQLINRLISCCKFWKIKCNTDISAAQVAYNKIFNG